MCVMGKKKFNFLFFSLCAAEIEPGINNRIADSAKVLLTNSAVTKWNRLPGEAVTGLLINIIIQAEAR